jgi:hypothetical protein
MMKRWLWLSLIFLVCAALAAVVFVCNDSLRGLLLGEASFQGHPTSYWREVLRKEDRKPFEFSEAPSPFFGAEKGVPVLIQCACDPDPHVRSAAINHLGVTGVHSKEVLARIFHGGPRRGWARGTDSASRAERG